MTSNFGLARSHSDVRKVKILRKVNRENNMHTKQSHSIAVRVSSIDISKQLSFDSSSRAIQELFRMEWPA